MASPETIAANGAGNTGALSADTVFQPKNGNIYLSTDAGTTYILFTEGEKVVFSSGLTVHWLNPGPGAVILNYMSL